MIVRSLKEIENTHRDIKGASGTWRSKRIILADDNVGFSFHETTVYAGTESTFWYKHHIEAVWCIEGESELVDETTGKIYQIGVGDMYLLDKHDKHTLRAKTLSRYICVFNPPITGSEDHDKDGVYKLVK
ncbi:ectoine synthase [Acinetobacter sp. HY1485]|uniref:ectoine synthase n=1 Tax=Acinetobacter sp. HY1485 TaxID=2970918 RepID=UPI0022B9CC8C|nr:ectoine synthase [Acinetobacter sp. HY1485]